MTILPLHDRTRSPADWASHLTESQHAVFLSDAASAVALTPAGEPFPRNQPPVCYVFDSLADAETFCNETAAASPRMRCDIYDRRGKAIAPRRTITHPSMAHHVPNVRSARRKHLAAWLLLIPPAPLFWLDYRHDGIWVVPTIVGFACIVTSARLFWWGHEELAQARPRE